MVQAPTLSPFARMASSSDDEGAGIGAEGSLATPDRRSGTGDKVKAFCSSLETAEDDRTKLEVLVSLAQLIDETQEGPDMLLLCHKIRNHRAVDLICPLVAHPEPPISQTALMLLANFTTVDIDPHAAKTAMLIKEVGGFPRIAAQLFSQVALTVALACGTIQNTCSDADVRQVLEELGAIDRLRELANCNQPAIVQASNACLHNLMEAMSSADKVFVLTRAVTKLQAARRRRVRMHMCTAHAYRRMHMCTAHAHRRMHMYIPGPGREVQGIYAPLERLPHCSVSEERPSPP